MTLFFKVSAVTGSLETKLVHIKQKSVPRQALLAVFVLGKLCHMGGRACACVTECANVHKCMHVYVHTLEQNWGYKQGCCVIVYTLCNKTRRAGG